MTPGTIAPAAPAVPRRTDETWWCVAALLPISVLYYQGLGPLAPVYVAGGAILVPLLVLRGIAGARFAQVPRSYCALLALAAYVVLLDVARGQAISPNSGNLIIGALAPLLVFSANRESMPLKTIGVGACAAIAILTFDRVLQFAGYQAPSPLNEIADPSLWYYQYKASYVAGDANSVGLFLVPLFALLRATLPIRGCFVLVAEYALQVVTFSKASIIAVVVRDLLQRTVPRWVRIAAVATFAGVAAYVALNVEVGKAFDSGSVKLETAALFAGSMMGSDAGVIAFGHGNNSALSALGIYLHAWPMTAAYETGLCGLALVIWYLVESYRESPRLFKLLHVPVFLVAGWSFLLYLGSMWLFLPHYVLLATEAEPSSPAAGTARPQVGRGAVPA